MKSTMDIVFDEEGVCDLGTDYKLCYTQIFTPIKGKIKQGNRNRILSTIIRTLIALNQTAPKDRFENVVFAINRDKMEIPLPNTEVMRILERTYKTIDEIELIPNAFKRFFFDESLQLTKEQKQSLVGKRISKGKSLKSQNIIREVLENWEYEEWGKITPKKITELSGLNRKTVYKYFKELMKEQGIV